MGYPSRQLLDPPANGAFSWTGLSRRSAHVSLAEKDKGEGRRRAARLAGCVRLPVGHFHLPPWSPRSAIRCPTPWARGRASFRSG